MSIFGNGKVQKGTLWVFSPIKLIPPGSTLHGYLSKIVTRYCQELQDAMVRSYQESHVSKKNLTKKPNMARKILLRSPIWQEKSH